MVYTAPLAASPSLAAMTVHCSRAVCTPGGNEYRAVDFSRTPSAVRTTVKAPAVGVLAGQRYAKVMFSALTNKLLFPGAPGSSVYACGKGCAHPTVTLLSATLTGEGGGFV